MLERTEPLLGVLDELVPERPFRIELWDGSVAEGEGPTFWLRSPRALRRLLTAPGQLGLGRAYVAGELEVDDLDSALEVVDRWRLPPLAGRDRVRLAAALAHAAGLGPVPAPPRVELRLRGARHTPRRDRAAVTHHYDVGNDFFALFLGQTMTYSCAFWDAGAETLDEAQREKLETVCRKLALRPGERLLDVGCGWGSLLEHAAREHGVEGVGITLSEPQAALARERLRGLPVEVRVADYRELGDERFDAVASVGMVEHVGAERIDEYARVLARSLAPGGRVLNHGIAHLESEYPAAGPFSQRYVFPDGDPLPVSRVLAALERAGLEPLHVEGYREDYARTLREWAANLDRNEAEALRLAGAERLRVWRLYLRAARRGFETGFTSIFQVVARPAPQSFGRRSSASGLPSASASPAGGQGPSQLSRAPSSVSTAPER